MVERFYSNHSYSLSLCTLACVLVWSNFQLLKLSNNNIKFHRRPLASSGCDVVSAICDLSLSLTVYKDMRAP